MGTALAVCRSCSKGSEEKFQLGVRVGTGHVGGEHVVDLGPLRELLDDLLFGARDQQSVDNSLLTEPSPSCG